jgi:RNA polymerase primary sigma factor
MSDSIKDYLNSIAKYPLLTPQQEIQLGRRVARLKELQQLERPLTKDEQRQVRSGERARQRFIQSNLQLVVHIARKYDKRQNKTLEFMDLIQEGNIGLSRAVDLFDPTRGYKFSTYAYWWIRQGITRALISYDAIIRLPIGVHEMLYKVNRTIQDLSHEIGQAPSTNQVAAHLDMDPKDLSMLLRQTYRVTSLDQHITDSESNTIAETIADPASNQEDVLIRQDIQNVMECFAKYLDETTQTVLKARMISQPMTWAELEKMTGINKTRLYSIQQRGIMRLRMLMSNPLAGTPLGTND